VPLDCQSTAFISPGRLPAPAMDGEQLAHKGLAHHHQASAVAPLRNDAAAGAARADHHRSRTLTDDLGSRQPPATSTSTRSPTHTSPDDLQVRSWRRLIAAPGRTPSSELRAGHVEWPGLDTCRAGLGRDRCTDPPKVREPVRLPIRTGDSPELSQEPTACSRKWMVDPQAALSASDDGQSVPDGAQCRVTALRHSPRHWPSPRPTCSPLCGEERWTGVVPPPARRRRRRGARRVAPVRARGGQQAQVRVVGAGIGHSGDSGVK
jgi:hypothetical protein